MVYKAIAVLRQLVEGEPPARGGRNLHGSTLSVLIPDMDVHALRTIAVPIFQVFPGHMALHVDRLDDRGVGRNEIDHSRFVAYHLFRKSRART